MYIKRVLDFCISLIAISILSPVFIMLSFMGLIFMRGNPFVFQESLSKDKKILLLRKTSLKGNDIIKQTTKKLENKRLFKISPIHFFKGCNLISNEFNTMAV